MSFHYYNYLCIFLFLGSYISIGQELSEKDSTSIVSFQDKIILKVNLDTRTDSYFINTNQEPSALELTQNTKTKVNLSFNYKFIGFSFGFAPNFSSNNDDNLKGKSTFQNYKIQLFLGKWIQEIQYTSNRGFYVENTRDFIPDWIEGKDPYILFPDLRFIKWSGATSYVFNSDFSLRNLLNQTKWQRKSAGSFIPQIDYQYQRFSNVSDVKSIEDSFDLGLRGSYHYTWVIHKRWFVSSYLSSAIGYRFLNYQEDITVAKKQANQYLLTGLDFGLQLGYTTKNLFFGANLDVDNSFYKEDQDSTVSNNITYAQIYVGYRFNEFPFLKKPLNWIENKFF